MTDTGDTKRPGFFKRAWRGDVSLWIPFCLFLTPSALTGAVLGTNLGLMLLIVTTTLLPLPALVPVALVVVAIPVVSAIMAWRCVRYVGSGAGRIVLKVLCVAMLTLAFYPAIRIGALHVEVSGWESVNLEKEYADAGDADGELLVAARYGDSKRAERILTQGANVHARQKKPPNVGRTPLHQAAGGYRGGPGRHLEVAKLLVAKGADVNARAEYGGYTALHVAAGLGNEPMVRFLIANGANLNAQDTLATPLSAAAVQGHLEIVKILLEHGADSNGVDGSGNRPLDRISVIGNWHADHDEIFIRLIRAGADLQPREKRGNPLISAVDRDRPRLALAMIEKGAVVDAGVVEAIGTQSQRDVAEALIRRKVSLFTNEETGSTLLVGAACSKTADFFDWVLTNTPDINAANKEGKTPLHKAAQCENAANAEKLLTKGADANRRDARGGAPINELYAGKVEPVAALLLKAGANPDNADNEGRTPLMTAARTNNAAYARLLIDHGADVNLKDRTGATALHEAAGRHEADVAEVILAAKGVKVNETNSKGQTALYVATQLGVATRLGAPKTVEMLIAKGADPSIQPPPDQQPPRRRDAFRSRDRSP